jgi:hypothetical protein
MSRRMDVEKKSSLKVRIEMLRGPDGSLESLRGDGWVLQSRLGNAAFLQHSDVTDEVSARSRLEHIGLLTSSRLRIEFCRARGA